MLLVACSRRSHGGERREEKQAKKRGETGERGLHTTETGQPCGPLWLTMQPYLMIIFYLPSSESESDEELLPPDLVPSYC